MSKAPSPLLGYNNNVRHKNRVFHIQTEDSGIKRPHIITHLFMDGGRILKSIKTSYSDHIGKSDMGDVVRQMMKEQHKAMFKSLRDGAFDHIVDEVLAGRKASEPGIPKIEIPRQPMATIPEDPPATMRDLPRETPPPLALDLDALGAGEATFKPELDLPPPPANLLQRGGPAESGTGRYRTVEEREERSPKAPKSERPRVKSERPPKSERAAARSERPPRSVPASAKRSESPRTDKLGAVREERTKNRPDPRAEPASEPKQPIASQSSRPGPGGARPPAIFGQARPQQSSIFGEDIISDKSLDEVILSYLAEDLEEGK